MRKGIKRYIVFVASQEGCLGVEEHNNGLWAKYEDVQTIETAITNAQRKIERIETDQARLVEVLGDVAEYFEHTLTGDPGCQPVDPVKTEAELLRNIKALTHKEER